MLLFFLTGLSFEIKRIIIAFWAFVKREIENILRKFWGGERRIATGAGRPRNDTLQKIRCKSGRVVREADPYGCVTRGAAKRADVGSELSAAGGRGSEVSEWPRSKLGASAVRQRKNFGYRNRIIGPYGSATRGAMGGRPQGSPLRKRYKGCGEAGGVEPRPYGGVISGAVGGPM